MNKQNLICPGDSFLVKDFFLFRTLNPETGGLYGLCDNEIPTQYCICLKIKEINKIKTIEVLTEYGIRYSYLKIFQNSAVLDNLPRSG